MPANKLQAIHTQPARYITIYIGSLLKRIIAVATSALVYTGIAFLTFCVWLSEAATNADAPQPLTLTSLLCLLATAIMALMQQKQFRSILVMGFCGLIVGFYLFPTSSMRPGTRFEAIRSGDFFEFTPFALCLGTFLGTLTGQNLTELRKLIAKCNRTSPR